MTDVETTALSAPRFRLTALGGVRVESAGGGRLHVQRKRLGLLVLLAVAGDRGESRDRLAAYLWPESDQDRARQSLKQAVYAIRQVLSEGAIHADRTIVRLNGAIVASDVGEFLRAMAAGDFSTAIDLYAGPFLDGWHMADGEELERWIEDRRNQLATNAAAALQKLATRAAASGDLDSSVRAQRRLVQLDPLATEHTAALMITLVRAGDVVSALREGERYQERMHRELGLVNPAISASMDRLRANVNAYAPPPSRASVAHPEVALPEHIVVRSDEATPSTVREARETSRRPRNLLRMAALACTFAVVAMVAVVLRQGPRSPSAPGSIVTVLPLRVRGSDTLAWRDASDVVAGVLNDTRDLHAVSDRGHLRRGWAACGATGGLYVSGEAEVRGHALVRLELRDACLRDSVIARSGATSTALDRTTLLERAALELVVARRSGQSRRVAEMAMRVTGDLHAAQAFVRGQADFAAARYDSAVAAFGRAAAIDSTFAVASLWQSIAADWAGRPLITESAARRAVALRQHLPMHDRMLADGWFAHKFGRASDAESVYTSVANSYPDDATAWMQLGEVLFHGNSVRGRPVQDAVTPFRRASALDSWDRTARHHLVLLAAMRGDTIEVDSLIVRDLSQGPDPDSVALHALQAFTHGDPAVQQRMLETLRRADPGTLEVSTWRTAAFARNVDAARSLATLLLNDSRAAAQRLFARDKLAEFAVAQGRWSDASAQLRQAAASDPDATLEFRAMLAVTPPIVHSDSELVDLRERLRRLLHASGAEAQKHVPVRWYLIGLLSDRLRDSRSLDASAVRLEALKDGDRYADPAFARSYAAGLRGLAARRAGHEDAAIAQLEAVPYDQFPEYRAGALGSQTYERYMLAELLAASGRTSEALSWLRAIGDGLETSWYPASHLAVARIADAAGDRHTAQTEYGRFVEAWRGCDAAQSSVRETARARIAAITQLARASLVALPLASPPANGAVGKRSPP